MEGKPIIDGLRPVNPALLADYEREMNEHGIPEIIRDVERRAALADEARYRRMEKPMSERDDPMRDMIDSNRHEILKKHEEAIRLIWQCMEIAYADKSGSKYMMEHQCVRVVAILDSLNKFHPMYGESWEGWPEQAVIDQLRRAYNQKNDVLFEAAIQQFSETRPRLRQRKEKSDG